MRGPPLHLGVILPNYGEALDAERLADAAVAAEQAGFDSGWVTDHLIVPSEHGGIYGTIAEALVSLGFLAARTHRLELGPDATDSWSTWTMRAPGSGNGFSGSHRRLRRFFRAEGDYANGE